jgi:hypothetical protein
MTDAKWLIKSPRLLVGDREVVSIGSTEWPLAMILNVPSSTLPASQSGMVSVLPKHS